MVDVLDGFFTDRRMAAGALEALAAIAPADRFWDDVEPFVEWVRRLAAEKLSTRERNKREEELRRALEHLRDTGAEALAFHEASDVLEWSPADFDLPAWPAATALCAELRDRLGQYAALQVVQPSTRTAARERRAQLEALEEEIFQNLGTLRGLLAGPKPPEPDANAAADRQQIGEDSPATPAVDELHAALDAEGDRYSVFTLEEEQRLAASRPGVCLVFASTATGLDSVEDSLAGMARRRAALVEVPGWVQPAEFVKWVKQSVLKNDHERVIAWQRLGRWSTSLESGLKELVEAQEGGRFRIVFVGDPAEARDFLSIDEAGRRVAARLDAVIPCGRWQISAIEQRIRETQLDAGSRGAADVMSATRGWHRLLDVLWARKSASPALESMIAAFDSTFRSPGGYSGFRAALGLSAFPEAETVFTLMATANYSPQRRDAAQRWIIDRGAGLGEEVVAQAIDFLTMFQLLEVDAQGNLALDPVAREVLKSDL